ncbi:unnamed protein product [Darwinula stevensoni]|uniref:Ubiquitin-like protease family profile domain-containing protein n=1 Tax=Darwinula stevensoni TaxID=69355 RepID=A0A7R9A4N2_9CRUS|nr:unnamed protein product [Darwinula stevensoni]CAG0893907.1 unnamed protein product [Darwinula stevensoni]
MKECNFSQDKDMKKKGRGTFEEEATIVDNIEVRSVKQFDNRGLALGLIMGKRDNRYAFMNPIAMARAKGSSGPSGPTIRDYLSRQRPTWEEVKKLLEKKKEGCSTLAAWEEKMNEKHREELRKQRELLLGGQNQSCESKEPNSKEKKKKKKKRKKKKKKKDHDSESDCDSSSDEEQSSRKRKLCDVDIMMGIERKNWRDNISYSQGEGSSEESATVFHVPKSNTEFLKVLLRLHHPSFIHHLEHWKAGDEICIATEEVSGLNPANIAHPFLIVSGLASILEALNFLHTKANQSHGSLQDDAIFISKKDGKWKLLLEGVRKSSQEEMLKDLLSFSALAVDLLSPHTESIPEAQDFIEVVSESETPVSIKVLQAHPVFHIDYMQVLSFLSLFTLKSSEERELFFRELGEKLYRFPEEVIGLQLSGLLTSRILLLDSSAHSLFLPFLLAARPSEQKEAWCGETPQNAIFGPRSFQKYMIPHISKAYMVLDAPIRIVLLQNLPLYLHAISKDVLQESLLPQILMGIHDTNDELVAVTLRALADLIPYLGASTVIGPKRKTLFSNALPKMGNKSLNVEAIQEGRSSPDGGEVQNSPCVGLIDNHVEDITTSMPLSLNKGKSLRLSTPSGNGRDESATDATTWENWESLAPETPPVVPVQPPSKLSPKPSLPMTTRVRTKTPILSNIDDDIISYDIKTMDWRTKEEEEDFFSDMQPNLSTKRSSSVSISSVSDAHGMSLSSSGPDVDLKSIEVKLRMMDEQADVSEEKKRMPQLDSIVLSYENSLLRESDLQLLEGKNWLNDKLIGFYFEYLYVQVLKENPKVCFLSPEVTQAVKLCSVSELHIFLDPLELHLKDIVFLPVNDSLSYDTPGGSHWSLLVFSRAKNAFCHFDSSSSSNRSHVNRLTKKIEPFFKVEGDIKVVDMKCTQQNNTYDCGVHVICNAEALVKTCIQGNNPTAIEICSIAHDLQEKRSQLKELIISLQRFYLKTNMAT